MFYRSDGPLGRKNKQTPPRLPPSQPPPDFISKTQKRLNNTTQHTHTTHTEHDFTLQGTRLPNRTIVQLRTAPTSVRMQIHLTCQNRPSSTSERSCPCSRSRTPPLRRRLLLLLPPTAPRTRRLPETDEPFPTMSPIITRVLFGVYSRSIVRGVGVEKGKCVCVILTQIS